MLRYECLTMTKEHIWRLDLEPWFFMLVEANAFLSYKQFVSLYYVFRADTVEVVIIKSFLLAFIIIVFFLSCGAIGDSDSEVKRLRIDPSNIPHDIQRLLSSSGRGEPRNKLNILFWTHQRYIPLLDV